MLHFSNDERICGTCAHYGQALAVTVLLPEGSPAGSGPRLRAPCLCHAVEPDAGFGAVVLLGPESHCRCHADAWQAAEDMDEPSDDGDDYGVRPGADFPWTLRR